MHRILKPNNAILYNNVNELKKYFNRTTKIITDINLKKLHELNNTFKNLPQNSHKNSFCLQHTNASEVIKAIESMKSDCFTGYDNIPVSVMKPVAEYITSTIAL